MSNCRPFTHVRLGSLRWARACRRKENGGHAGDDRTPCGRNKNRQIAYLWHSRAIHYVTFQLPQINLSACSMKRSVLCPPHNKHIFLSTRRKQCSSGNYSVVWTRAHYQLSNRGKFHVAPSSAVKSWVPTRIPPDCVMRPAATFVNYTYVCACVIFTRAAHSPVVALFRRKRTVGRPWPTSLST
jgi:hypothetical protein